MAGRFDQEYQQLKERTHRWVVERLDEEGIEVGKATRDALAELTRNHVGQYISHNRVPLSTQRGKCVMLVTLRTDKVRELQIAK